MNKIKQIWKNYCLEKWAKDTYAPTNPFQRLIRRILYDAVKNNADCLFIGKPTNEYEIEGEKEPNITLATMEEIIEEMGNDPQASEDDIKLIKDFHEETQKRIAETKGNATIPLKDSPVERLPIWHCFNGKCSQQEDGILLFMFTEFIDAFVYNNQTGIDISEWSEKPTQVYYTIRMQENFCFSVTIDKIEKIPNK